MIVLINIDDVFARGEDLRTAAPTKNAKALYDGFRSQHNAIGFTRASEDIVKWWLKREHLDQWSAVMSYPDNALTWDEWRIDRLRDFLAQGWEVFAFVDTSPEVVESAIAMGVTGIRVGYPHMPVGWKEVSAPRAWTDVVTSMDR
jgi:hypothetical protein